MKHGFIIPALALAVLLIGSIFRIHGYSVPIWHGFIDGSPPTEVIFGKLRDIRSDDWLVDIPLNLAQLAHTPPFPINNQNIGSGQSMIAPARVPLATLWGLFRPSTWGFWIGADFGIAWLWWFQVVGVFLAHWWLFLIISNQDRWISFWGALALTVSPVFGIWTYFRAEIQLLGTLSLALAMQLFWSNKSTHKLLLSVALVWALCSFLFSNFYPPFQVAHAFLGLFIFAAFLWHKRPRDGVSWLGLSLSIGVVGAICYLFYATFSEILHEIGQTVYPGLRHNPGGGYPLFRLLTDNLLLHMKKGVPWHTLGNICEASSGILLFPLVVGYGALDRKIFKFPILLAAMAFLVCCFLYAVVGLPDWLARLTLLGKLTPNRISTSMAVADTLLVVVYYVNWQSALPRRQLIVALAIWILFHVLLDWRLFQATHAAIPFHWFMTILLQGTLGYLFFQKPRWVFPALSLFGLAIALNFNPIVRGGGRFIVENPLRQEFKRLHAKLPGRWAIFGKGEMLRASILSNLPRMIGIPALGGFLNQPELTTLSVFDPQSRHIDAYNRIAALNFEQSANTEIVSTAPGQVVVRTEPTHPGFMKLGLRLFAFVGEPSGVWFDRRRFELLSVSNGVHFFRSRD